MTKYKFLLLDSNIIIELMRLGKWEAVVDTCEVHIGDTILSEAHYYEDDTGKRCDFDLKPYIEQHKACCAAATTQQFRALGGLFQPQFLADSIHVGEEELLAIVCGSNDPWVVASADIGMVKAMAAVGKADQLLSLETLLQKIGQQSPKLQAHFKEDRLRLWIKWGQAQNMQGRIKK